MKKNIEINQSFINELPENLKPLELYSLEIYEGEMIEGFTFLAEMYLSSTEHFLNKYLESINLSMTVFVEPYDSDFLRIKVVRRKKL